MSGISTHVLDTAAGRPAVGVPVRLERIAEHGHVFLAAGSTDADGRIGEFDHGRLAPATYRLVFDTAAHFAANGRSAFFPEVAVTFVVRDPSEHHHIPVLLSPYSYSTYRGS
jgi:5-hydroxyisourate hydrolase